MGKPQRRDLGGVDRDRDTLRHFSQPKYVKSQKFSSNPLGSNITRQLALGALRGVNIVSVATDDVLAWDGTAWIATAESGTGGSGLTLPATLPVNAIGNTTPTVILDLAETSAHVHTLTLVTNTVLAFSNIPAQHINFEIDSLQDSTGGWELTFDTASAVIEATPGVNSTADRQTVFIGQTHGTTTSTAVFDIFETALRGGAGTGDNLGNHTMTQNLLASSFQVTGIERLLFREGGNLISSAADLTMNFQVTTGGIFDWFEGQRKYMELGATTWFIDLATDASMQMLMRNQLQRFTMNNTNTVFLLPDSGRFVIQSSDEATDFVLVDEGQDQMSINMSVLLSDGKLFQVAESVVITNSAILPTATGEIRTVTNDIVVFTGGTTKNLSDIGAAADNLGDHTATEDLKMASFSVTGVVDIRMRAGTMALKSSTSEMSLHVATDQSFQLINRNGLQRMTMDATNSVFLLPDTGKFIIQSSDSTTDFVEVNPSDILLNRAVTVSDGHNLTLNEALFLADSGLAPTNNGEIRLPDATDIVAFSGGKTRNLSNIPNATTLEMGGAVINEASGIIFNDEVTLNVAAGSVNLRLPNNDVMQTHINAAEIHNINQNLGLWLTNVSFGDNYITFNEMTAPTAGGDGTARLFISDAGGGKTHMGVIFASGATQIIATEP